MASRFTLKPENVGPPTSTPAILDVKNGILVLVFPESATKTAVWSFYAPQGLTSTYSLVLKFAMSAGTSGNVRLSAEVEAFTALDATNIVTTDSFDTANLLTQAIPGTVGYMGEATIPLTNNDSMAAGDKVRIRVSRLPADGADTATGDLYYYGAEFRDSA